VSTITDHSDDPAPIDSPSPVHVADSDGAGDAAKPPTGASAEPAPGIGLGGATVLIVLILCATTIAIWFRFFSATETSVDRGLESIEKAAKVGVLAAVTIAREFQPEYVNETFIEWSQPSVQGNEGNILEIATATSTESFASQTYYTAFGKQVPGSKVVSKITVPSTYRYHIDLSQDWHLVPRDQRMYVVAPNIMPSLPVAIDTAGMKKEVEGSWMRVNEHADLDALQATLTTELALRAADPKTIEQVSDEARISVAKFVKAWLLSNDHWRSDRFNEIIIVFDNEVDDRLNYDYESRLPTLRWSNEAPPIGAPAPQPDSSPSPAPKVNLPVTPSVLP
jgi:hypothetical protein